ncbi:Hypothetical predicted protein, partial [Podarcis lilfordi]
RLSQFFCIIHSSKARRAWCRTEGRRLQSESPRYLLFPRACIELCTLNKHELKHHH